MKLHIWALALSGVVVASPAMAACPDTALQQAADLLVGLGQPNSAVSAYLASIDGLVQVCPADPYVLKVAAMTYNNAAARGPDGHTALINIAKSRALLGQLDENFRGTTGPKTVLVNGQPVAIGFDDLYELETTVLNGEFTTERNVKELAPEDMPIGQGAPMRACRQGDPIDAQRARFFIDKQGAHAGAMNLLDRVAQYCAAQLDFRVYDKIALNRAEALVSLAKKDPAQPGVLDMLRRAKADSIRYVTAEGGYDLSWDARAANDLDKMIVAAMEKGGTAPGKEKWFSADLMKDPMTEQFISWRLDAAWAADNKAGAADAAKAYRAAIADLFALASASADPATAKRMLASAARDHSSGKYGAPENHSLRSPPDALWTFIDPGVKPVP